MVFERQFKKIESLSGGPVSVHGATVFYKKDELIKALDSLKYKENWKNDDVVIPMKLRSLFPYQTIFYLSNEFVRDSKYNKRTTNEFGRRKRMVIGNLEWLIEGLCIENNTVFILSLRRIFKILWCYWFISFFLR